ncbi:MAG: AAA family ATPase [Actinobacteria bacterium]|nr:AAA family ATPase [Actinomycetota bacterium]
MEPTRGLPFVVSLDDTDDPADVIDALALGRFAAGIEPAARSAHLSRLRPDAPLLPPGVECTWSVEGSGRRAHLAEGEGWTLRAVRWSDASGELTVTARTAELASGILEAATRGAVEPAGDEDAAVTVGFWHLRPCGSPRRTEREVAIEPWVSIRDNYTRSAVESMDAVMAVEPAFLSGRLLLLHGPPGTGKTTAVRALAHAWRSWCRLEVVLDPEKLLADPSYLLTLALGDQDDDRKRWRLVVLEDCDELIRADAKSSTGQSLGRLLNLTDGIVGQGLEVMVAITTNEPVHHLHPAIIRPGRCLAEVFFGPLTHLEALRWLGRSDGVGPDGATLAELFLMRGQLYKVEQRPPTARPGHYL